MDPAVSPGARARAAAERKALRRTRVELASGGRCERAERVFSDQLDGVVAPADERFLAAHLARCRRCRTHVAELAALPPRAQPAPPPEPAPRALPRAPARRHLRPVPTPPLLEPAPAANAELALVEEPTTTVTDQPAPTPIRTSRRERSVPDRPPPTPAHVAVRRNRKNPAIPVLVAALIAAGLIVLAIILLQHFNNPHSHAHAPWSDPNAPLVHPSPLKDQ